MNSPFSVLTVKECSNDFQGQDDICMHYILFTNKKPPRKSRGFLISLNEIIEKIDYLFQLPPPNPPERGRRSLL